MDIGMGWLPILFLVSAFIFSGVHLGLLMKYDTNETYKYMRVAGPVLYLVGFMAFVLAAYSINQDNTYLLHILYGVVMLVCLPAALFSASVAFIIGGNI
jgi:hypothetical protein